MSRPKRRLSKKKILSQDLGRIIMVLCPVLHNHGMTLFMQYIFWGYGYYIDEPTYEEVMDVVDETGLSYEGWEVIESPCWYCRNHLPA